MTENSDNQISPNDPAYLASRSMDDELGVEDRATLDQAMAESAELRDVQAQLRTVDCMVRGLGDAPIELDWENHATLISAQIEHDDASDGDLDAVLNRWADCTAHTAPQDEERFTASVMQQIAVGQEQSGVRRRLPLVFRVAIPLAAAAAIVFSITGRVWVTPTTPSLAISFRVGTTPKAESARRPAHGTVHVAFARTPARSALPERRTNAISFGSVGAEPLGVESEIGS